MTCYDTYRLFINGESHYRALFQDIKQAKECIYVLFYTIHHDVMGEALVKALTQKAEEGVTVMVMCDFIANLSTPRKMYEPLVKAGGKVIRVKPYLTHYRSHRKIVTIDHKIGYIGGMNIGKQYANLAEKKNPWRDTQIRLTGACAAVLDALKTAAASGVRVELMIPGIKASFFLDPVTTYYAGQIMEFGAAVYKYHGYIHAKTMTVDDELCCIGSVNMDIRSLMVDDEICGIFYANDMVEEYIRIFENDIQNCDPYFYEQFLKRSQKEKIAECVFLPFAPLM